MLQADTDAIAAMPKVDQVASAMSPVDQVATAMSPVDQIQNITEEYDNSEEDYTINYDGQDVENSGNNQPVGESIIVHDPQGIQLQVDLSKWFHSNHNDSVVPSSRVSRDTKEEEAAGSHHMVTRTKSKKLPIIHVSFTTEGSSVEPKTVSQALATPHWSTQVSKGKVREGKVSDEFDIFNEHK
ncbi:hypothetical protein HAX54_035695 [Datura stramonium]|uniref:Uncharacterized protein n=1 Tax=Datura stramonium TaxID=4076 RepID=A0ABS8SFI7_DATST|nr:hypothetical protein [Datura stramonium]